MEEDSLPVAVRTTNARAEAVAPSLVARFKPSKRVLAVIVGAAGTLLGVVLTELFKSWWDRPILKIQPVSVVLDGYESKSTRIRPAADFRFRLRKPMLVSMAVSRFMYGQSVSLDEFESMIQDQHDNGKLITTVKDTLGKIREIVENRFPEGPSNNRKQFIKEFLNLWAGQSTNVLDAVAVRLLSIDEGLLKLSEEDRKRLAQEKTAPLVLNNGLAYPLNEANQSDPIAQVMLSSGTRAQPDMPPTLVIPQVLFSSLNRLRFLILYGEKDKLKSLIALIESDLTNLEKENQGLLSDLNSIKSSSNPSRIHVVVVASNLGRTTVSLHSNAEMILIKNEPKTRKESTPFKMRSLFEGRLSDARPIVLEPGKSSTLDLFSDSEVSEETSYDLSPADKAQDGASNDTKEKKKLQADYESGLLDYVVKSRPILGNKEEEVVSEPAKFGRR